MVIKIINLNLTVHLVIYLVFTIFILLLLLFIKYLLIEFNCLVFYRFTCFTTIIFFNLTKFFKYDVIVIENIVTKVGKIFCLCLLKFTTLEFYWIILVSDKTCSIHKSTKIMISFITFLAFCIVFSRFETNQTGLKLTIIFFLSFLDKYFPILYFPETMC